MNDIENVLKKELYYCVKVDSTYQTPEPYVTGKLVIIFCITGHADVLVGNKQCMLDKNHFLFLHPHAELNGRIVSDDFSAYVIGFSLGIQESEIAQMDPSFFAQVLKTPCWEINEAQQKAMLGFCESFHYVCQEVSEEFKSDIISSYFSAFLKTFYSHTKHQFVAEDKTTKNSGRMLTIRFFSLLQKNYRKDHRVAFYAEQLYVSPKYLTQVIKETCHFTPKTLIDNKLAIEALFKLGRTMDTIQEISFYLGFPDQSYFGRFFKRMFGMSPLAYRMNPNLDLIQKLQTPRELQNEE